VLSRGIAAKTAATNNGGNNDNNGGTGGATGGTGGTGGGTPDPAATTAPNPTSTPTGRDPGVVMGPSTDSDWKAIEGAALHGDEPVEVSGRKIAPAASIGRNGLPGTVIAVLALLAVAALATTVPFVRRRALTHRSA